MNLTETRRKVTKTCDVACPEYGRTQEMTFQVRRTASRRLAGSPFTLRLPRYDCADCGGVYEPLDIAFPNDATAVKVVPTPRLRTQRLGGSPQELLVRSHGPDRRARLRLHETWCKVPSRLSSSTAARITPARR